MEIGQSWVLMVCLKGWLGSATIWLNLRCTIWHCTCDVVRCDWYLSVHVYDHILPIASLSRLLSRMNKKQFFTYNMHWSQCIAVYCAKLTELNWLRDLCSSLQVHDHILVPVASLSDMHKECPALELYALITFCYSVLYCIGVCHSSAYCTLIGCYLSILSKLRTVMQPADATNGPLLISTSSWSHPFLCFLVETRAAVIG